MSVRDLPPARELTEYQRRGWSCVWCHAVLDAKEAVDLGQQRVKPDEGAAYSWFPRACADKAGCAEREQALP